MDTCGLRNWVREVRVFQKLVDNWLINFPTSAHLAIFVIFSLAACQVSDSGIYENVAWPRVEIVGLIEPAFSAR